MPFDPGKLLRKSWDSPDELAHELYVLLQTLVPSMPQLPRGQRPNPPLSDTTSRLVATVMGYPARRQEQAQRRLGGPTVEAITQGRAALLDGRTPAVPPASSYRPSRPPLPSVGQHIQSVQLLVPAVAVSQQIEVTAPTPTPPEIVNPRGAQTIPLAGSFFEGEGSPPTEIRAGVVPARSIPVPDTAIGLRGSVFTTTPPVTEAVDDRAKTMPVSAPTGLRLSPRNEQAASASAGLVLDTEANLVAFSPAPAKTGDDPLYPPTPVPDWDDPTPNTPFDEGTLWIAYIEPSGVPGARMGSTSQVSLDPGQGQAYLMDFDPDEGKLRMYSGDLVSVLNYGFLPISGETFWPLKIVNNVLWLNPNPTCHAIVTQTIGPASGITPGGGQVQCYYLSNAVMTADTPLQVENWFNATAPLGAHCAVAAVDKTAALWVLDCPPSSP